MWKTGRIPIAIILFTFASCRWQPVESSPSSSAKKPYLNAAPVESQLKLGASGKVKLKLTIAEGIHIQANPASKPNLIPTTLSVPGTDGISLGDVVYPPGKPFRLKGSDAEIATYDGVTYLEVPVKVAATVDPGARKLKGKLRYQACNEKSCFFPKTIPVELSLTIKK